MWDKSDEGVRNFLGCGGAWLPQSGIHQPLDVFLWRPTSLGLGALAGGIELSTVSRKDFHIDTSSMNFTAEVMPRR